MCMEKCDTEPEMMSVLDIRVTLEYNLMPRKIIKTCYRNVNFKKLCV